MDQLKYLKVKIREYIWLLVIAEDLLFLTLILTLSFTTHFHLIDKALIAFGAVLIFNLIFIIPLSNIITEPIEALWLAILHISPSSIENIKAPDLSKLHIGKELVTNLVGQVYQLNNIGRAERKNEISTYQTMGRDFLAKSLPLPIIILDNLENISYANNATLKYLNKSEDDLIGKNVYAVLDMSFPTEDTFDTWLKNAKQTTAISSNVWERVKLNVDEQHPTLYFDLAAYYNLENKDNNNTIIVLFDHTKLYSQDDQAISFIALAVHELRTPLTLLRGYIEAFSQELSGKLNPELQSFLDKMKAASDQLTSFTNNILNVARVDNDQMELNLGSEEWSTILTEAVQAIRIRAQVRGIEIKLNIAPNLPKVGVDRLSIQEVIYNLIDNAIKYSANSKQILINSMLNNEGLVETTVQDFGRGVPESIIANLFTKFYRDHHNRSQVGGTGLGLYLSKAIIDAHDGNIWVHSKEGEGSTFGFTVLPVDRLSEEKRLSSNDTIVHNAHGWIKNHSYYRR